MSVIKTQAIDFWEAITVEKLGQSPRLGASELHDGLRTARLRRQSALRDPANLKI
jgi:hypothetical protein